MTNDACTGKNAGAALGGYMSGVMETAADGVVAGWYATFLESVIIPNAVIFSYMVAWGELLIGLGLIVGLLTGIAAFFGALMNMSFLLAGTVSSNPVMLVVLGWKVGNV